MKQTLEKSPQAATIDSENFAFRIFVDIKHRPRPTSSFRGDISGLCSPHSRPRTAFAEFKGRAVSRGNRVQRLSFVCPFSELSLNPINLAPKPDFANGRSNGEFVLNKGGGVLHRKHPNVRKENSSNHSSISFSQQNEHPTMLSIQGSNKLKVNVRAVSSFRMYACGGSVGLYPRKKLVQKNTRLPSYFSVRPMYYKTKTGVSYITIQEDRKRSVNRTIF